MDATKAACSCSSSIRSIDAPSCASEAVVAVFAVFAVLAATPATAAAAATAASPPSRFITPTFIVGDNPLNTPPTTPTGKNTGDTSSNLVVVVSFWFSFSVALTSSPTIVSVSTTAAAPAKSPKYWLADRMRLALALALPLDGIRFTRTIGGPAAAPTCKATPAEGVRIRAPRRGPCHGRSSRRRRNFPVHPGPTQDNSHPQKQHTTRKHRHEFQAEGNPPGTPPNRAAGSTRTAKRTT